jgi:hypothetical protein
MFGIVQVYEDCDDEPIVARLDVMDEHTYEWAEDVLHLGGGDQSRMLTFWGIEQED